MFKYSFGKLIRCHTVTLFGARMLVASKSAFLENYLAVSTCILDGSSIECHEKKRQRFSLSGVRFGSGAIQISEAVENELSTLDSFLQRVV